MQQVLRALAIAALAVVTAVVGLYLAQVLHLFLHLMYAAAAAPSLMHYAGGPEQTTAEGQALEALRLILSHGWLGFLLGLAILGTIVLVSRSALGRRAWDAARQKRRGG